MHRLEARATRKSLTPTLSRREREKEMPLSQIKGKKEYTGTLPVTFSGWHYVKSIQSQDNESISQSL